MLLLVDKHGKNWSKILNNLHNKHCCENIDKGDKVRTRFNTLNGPNSKLRKNSYKRKVFSLTKDQKKLTKEEQKSIETSFAAQEQKNEQEWDHAKVLLQKIAKREKLPTSEDAVVSEESLSQSLLDVGNERREQRAERLKKWEEDAEEDREYKREIRVGFKRLNENLDAFLDLEKQGLELLREAIELKKQKRRRLNDNF